MRKSLILITLIAALSAPPAAATETTCDRPAAPPVPTQSDANPDGMKVYAEAYRDYALALQAYLNCLSAQAQTNPDVADAVTKTKSLLDIAKEKLAQLAQYLQTKMPAQ